MSADNWAICPRCAERVRHEREAARNAVMSSYGKVPVEQFDRDRAALIDPAEPIAPTFREDYEIYGAETGIHHVSYHGACSECGLCLQYEDKQMFWPEGG